MTKTAEATVVRKRVRVEGAVERAFSIFVEQMETWWPAEHHIGKEAFQAIFVEPRVGGRWYERDAKGTECNWGHVLAWEPPHRVAFSWHLGPDFKFNPDMAKASEVEIRFSAHGPASTQVDLEHSKLERHGEGYELLYTMMDSPNAWAQTLAEFARVADGRLP